MSRHGRTIDKAPLFHLTLSTCPDTWLFETSIFKCWGLEKLRLTKIEDIYGSETDKIKKKALGWSKGLLIKYLILGVYLSQFWKCIIDNLARHNCLQVGFYPWHSLERDLILTNVKQNP